MCCVCTCGRMDARENDNGDRGHSRGTSAVRRVAAPRPGRGGGIYDGAGGGGMGRRRRPVWTVYPGRKTSREEPLGRQRESLGE